MSLPRIKIQFMNGMLGTVSESADGLLALVISATAVSDKFALNTPYTIYRPDGLKELGITKANNAKVVDVVTNFYNEAEEGTKVVVYGVAASDTMTDLCNKNTGALKDLILDMNGQLRGIVIVPGAEPTTGADGLDADVFSALPVAQALAEYATTQLYAPLFIALPGIGYDGSLVMDLSSENYNRVMIVLGDQEESTMDVDMGTFAGRVATTPVQRNIGRVKSGSIYPNKMYLGDKLIGLQTDVLEALHDKRYVCPRRYAGRSGYYYADDCMACDPTDDYASLANRRVIDKAYRIVYNTLLDCILDELEVNDDGTLRSDVIRYIEQNVEDAIDNAMTVNGELSSNSNGEGCTCVINPDVNVLATSKLEVTIKVRPHGYARDVEVKLGFLVTKSEE